jgi:hypothetical protein
LQLGLVSESLEFYPNQIFDENKHRSDAVAMEYVEKAANDVRHLVPADVLADRNCLYNSIVLLMDSAVVTASELRGMEIRFFLMEFASVSECFSPNDH